MYKYIVYADEFKKGTKEPAELILLLEHPYDIEDLMKFSISDYLSLFYKSRVMKKEDVNEITLETLNGLRKSFLIVNSVVFDGIANDIDEDIPFNSEKNLQIKIPRWASQCDHVMRTFDDELSTVNPVYSDGKQKYVCYKCGKIMEGAINKYVL